MKTVQIPLPFLKALAAQSNNLQYLQTWISWFTDYGEKLKDPFFINAILLKEKQIENEDLEKLKATYDFGKPWLQALEFGKADKPGTKKQLFKKEQLTDAAKKILEYLNLKTNSCYGKIKAGPALKPIIEKLFDGYTPQDCVTVIDKKYIEWVGTDFEVYMRPSTLFGDKFDTYLNQPIKNGRNSGQTANGNHHEQINDAVQTAIQINDAMYTKPAGN